MIGRTISTLAVLVGTTSAVAGCAASAGGPTVASVAAGSNSVRAAVSGSASAGTTPVARSSAAADARRPVLRVDDSPEHVASLWNAYNTCLLRHGAHRPPAGGMSPALGGNGNDPGVLVQYPGPPAAQAACLALEPKQDPTLDASTNPQFHQRSLAYVSCMQRRGLFVRLLNDHDLSWTFAAGHTAPSNADQIDRVCLLSAFGAK